ncbi:MAG TPA: GNAT family N-acetyltransferase [Baekduia sp.]|nr:GNAT family N-acetyltransferase [Baekduia sp.]
MRAYCEFYETEPLEFELGLLCEALLADPEHEGFQLIARDDAGAAIGFATVFWSWSTLDACRLAIMNDLFVADAARGHGVGDALITACAQRARDGGAKRLSWQTAYDNHRAQAVYDRVGAQRLDRWLDYELEL